MYMETLTTYPTREDYDFLFKVTVIGDWGAGKSSLLQRHKEGKFSEEPPKKNTGFLEDHCMRCKIDGYRVVLDMWDPHGSERFGSVSTSFYRRTKANILCCPIGPTKYFNRDERLQNVGVWHKECLQANRFAAAQKEQVPVQILVGTKADLDPNFYPKKFKKIDIQPPDPNYTKTALCSFPQPLLYHILTLLSVSEVSICSQLNRFWYGVVNSDMLWCMLFKKQFPKKQLPAQKTSWKEEYKRIANVIVTMADVEKTAKELSAPCIFTSAKDGTNVNELFEQIARELLQRALAMKGMPLKNTKRKKGFFSKLFKNKN